MSTWSTPAWRQAPELRSPGGLTARQLLDAVRRIAMELPLAGMDVVEVSPPYDHAEVTAYLANRVVLEALSGIAWRRRRAAGRPAPIHPLRCSLTASVADLPASPTHPRRLPGAGR